MKEITALEKQKIFAKYWRQEIAVLKEIPDSQPGHVCNISTKNCNMFSLLVTPIQDISDEDAIEVANILWPDQPLYHSVKEGKFYLQSFIWAKEFDNEPYEMYPHNVISVLDFLRSKGYALPADGYSVDELVAAGIFKLKTKEG